MTNHQMKQALDSNLSAMHLSRQSVNRIMANISEGKKVKKKLSVAFVMTMILVLLAATALAVTMFAGRQRLLNEDGNPQPLSCAVMEDTLYIMTNRGLMTWQEGDTKPEPLMDDQTLMASGIFIDSLLFSADDLMLLDPDTGTVWAYRQNGFTRVVQTDSSVLPLQSALLSDPVYQNGSLYIRAVPTDALEEEATVYRFDLNTGAVTPLPVQGVIELTAYRDGELLALRRGLPGAEAVITIDAQSGETLSQITSMEPLTLKGLAYDVHQDEIYAVDNGMISVWQDAQWTQKQTVTLPTSSFFYSVLGDGFVTASYDGIQLINFEADASGPVLSICGWTDISNLDDEYAAAHPEIQIQRETKMHFCGQELKEALLSGDTTDLFYVKMDADVIALMQSGQLGLLTESAVLTADAASMLPQIRDAVTQNSTLYALADELYLPAWMIRTDAETAAPQTMLELLTQDVAWSARAGQSTMLIANDYSTTPWAKTDYARYALQETLMEAEAAGETPDFSSGSFTAFLEALKGAQLSQGEYPEQSSVITAAVTYSLQGIGETDGRSAWQWMRSPTIDAQAEACIPSSLYVYVVNPNGANREAAIAYLEYAARHRPAGMQALLSPSTVTPSLYAYAQDDPYLQALPESWEVTAQALEEYQTSIAPGLNLMLSPLLLDQYAYHSSSIFGEMLESVQAYLHGDTTLEACIAELNNMN